PHRLTPASCCAPSLPTSPHPGWRHLATSRSATYVTAPSSLRTGFVTPAWHLRARLARCRLRLLPHGERTPWHQRSSATPVSSSCVSLPNEPSNSASAQRSAHSCTARPTHPARPGLRGVRPLTTGTSPALEPIKALASPRWP